MHVTAGLPGRERDKGLGTRAVIMKAAAGTEKGYRASSYVCGNMWLKEELKKTDFEPDR